MEAYAIFVLLLTGLCVIIGLAVWHYCEPERFTPEQINRLAESVMKYKHSGLNAGDDGDDGDDQDGDGDGDGDGQDDAAGDDDSVEVSAEFGPLAASLYKNNKDIYDKLLQHAKSARAFDLVQLGQILDIPCIGAPTTAIASTP